MGLSEVRWRKSSYSSHDGGQCVEVAGNPRGTVIVRDSKAPDGPVLTFTAAEWGAFVLAMKREG